MRSRSRRPIPTLVGAALLTAAAVSAAHHAAAGAGTTDTTTTGTEDDPATGGEWTVDVSDCVDPERVVAPIEDRVVIASAAPLSGGPAAAAFVATTDGFRAYIDYANEHDLLPGYELVYDLRDDQYDAARTPLVINTALDEGAHVVAAITGTGNNLAVRDLLNEECIPQLLSQSGAPTLSDPANFPWTTGMNMAYDLEASAYAEDAAREFPDGATAAVLYINNDAGFLFRDGFARVGEPAGIEVVAETTIEPADVAPPVAQVATMAREQPDIVAAFPLGAQCPTFLNELANAKAAQPGWEPRVYLTGTCASALILAGAAENADGILTAGPAGHVDTANPALVDDPDVALYLDTMEAAGLSHTVPTSEVGWTIADVLVAILRQAAESPGGMTQLSIMEAAYHLDYAPALAIDGLRFKTSGVEDPFFIEDVQLWRYDAAGGYFEDVGELITKFRSS